VSYAAKSGGLGGGGGEGGGAESASANGTTKTASNRPSMHVENTYSPEAADFLLDEDTHERAFAHGK